MTKEELLNIIKTLEEKTSKENATFGIFHGHESVESLIRANKDGLQLFAIELLRAANETDDILKDPEKNIIPISSEADWINDESQTIIQYVHPIENIPLAKEDYIRKEGFFEKFIPLGCLAVLIIIVVALIVGLWTLIKWIF